MFHVQNLAEEKPKKHTDRLCTWEGQPFEGFFAEEELTTECRSTKA